MSDGTKTALPGFRHAVRATRGAIPAYLLFSMMLFVPTTYMGIKALLLTVTLILIVRYRRLVLHRSIVMIASLMVIVGASFMLLGAAHGGPGALRVGSVHVLWPIVFLVLAAGASDLKIIEVLFRIMVGATICISAYALLYVGHTIGYVPGWLYIEIDQGQTIGLHETYIGFNLYSIASLIFLVPFNWAVLSAWPKDRPLPVHRAWVWLGLALGIAATLVSGRRALFVVVMSAPVVTALMMLIRPPQDRRSVLLTQIGALLGVGAIAVVGLVVVLPLLGFEVGGLKEMFLEGFAFGDATQGAWSRREQFEALTEGFRESPFFGEGLGVGTTGSIRSTETLWSYELTYVMFLYQIGLVGSLAFGFGVLWIFWRGAMLIRRQSEAAAILFPILVGVVCFLIGNATNPYMAKFDYMWVLHLPIAIINEWLLRAEPTGDARSPAPSDSRAAGASALE